METTSLLPRFVVSHVTEVRAKHSLPTYRYKRFQELVVATQGLEHLQFWPEALCSILSDCQLFTFQLTPLNKSHIVLSIHREMRMDLNQKTLVSHEYFTGFVDCRHINSRTTILFVLLAIGGEGGKGGQH